MADVLVEMAPSEEPLPLTPAPASLDDTLRELTELPALAIGANSEFFEPEPATDGSSTLPSFSSTPPTSMTDAASISSDISKHDLIAALTPIETTEHKIEQTVEVGTPQPDLPEPQPSTAEQSEVITPKRARTSRSTTRTPVYNLAKLAGTHIHGKRRANGDHVREKRRRITPTPMAANEQSAIARTGDALDAASSVSVQLSPKNGKQKKEKGVPAVAPRRSTRATGEVSDPMPSVPSAGRRGRNIAADTASVIPRELRRLRDTNEFVGIEKKPVLHTIWSNGKYVDPNDLDENGEPIRKKARKTSPKPVEPPVPVEQTSKETTPAEPIKQKRVKKWLTKGLYAGQDTPADYTTGLSTADKKKLAQIPELKSSGKVNKVLPLPMFGGLRLLINGRDFKLPFDVCNPLPPGQPKPDEWRKMTKNRFVGDAGTYWRKTDHFKDYQSKCICKPVDGCAEDCQNRIMLYECDDTNCNAGKDYCQNRAFQNLTERTKKGGRFRVGVEVLKTSDRGYGVRSNRCFEPNQIIMEYTGEIITEAECERRMNEKYKDNECYYLMAFDQNMIIDATTGSIARFVNHSCNPNCRMEKWIVHGQPRMALFAGERPIMTGEELTYDYNFDPFSAKNVQKCLCGSVNCRGILGPKSKMPKEVREAVKAVAKAGKRKLKALLEGEDETATTAPSKKQKVIKAKSAKAAAAAATVKKMLAGNISVNAKGPTPKSSTEASKPKKQTASVSVRNAKLVKAARVYNKNGKQLLLADSIVSTSTTVAAASGKAGAKGRKTKDEQGTKKKSDGTEVKKSPAAKTKVLKKTTKTVVKSPKATITKPKKTESKTVKTTEKAISKKTKAATAPKKTSTTAKATKSTATVKKAGTAAVKATKIAGKGAIKTTPKKGSSSTAAKTGLKTTIKSAKHTISKTIAAGKKKTTTVEKTVSTAKKTVQKSRILPETTTAKVTKKYGKKGAATATLGMTTILVKGPARKPLEQKSLEQAPQGQRQGPSQAEIQAQDKLYEFEPDLEPVLQAGGPLEA